MSRKYEVTGAAVIYTADGAKIIDCEVRRWANAHGDGNDFRFDNAFRKEYGEKYILIGGARTVPTEDSFAKPAFHPETVTHAFNYARSKFFRLMLDLMRLAQWEPINKANYVLHGDWFMTNQFHVGQKPDINFDEPIDEQFYRKYEFTQPMIDFVEKKI